MPEPAGAPTTTVDPDLDRRTGHTTRTGPPHVAHIVKTDPGQSALAKVTEARVYGYPVEALCGERFVPQRDPRRLPPCRVCQEVYELYRQASDGRLDDAPGA